MAVKLTPHGPLQAVMVMLPAAIHGGASMTGAGIINPAGCPESIFVMSGAGPCGPNAHGVWQSLHPEVVTRYFPRSTVGVAEAEFVESMPGELPFFGVQPARSAEIAIAAKASKNGA